MKVGDFFLRFKLKLYICGMKRFLVLIIGVLLIGGCGKDCRDDPDLTADELSWLSFYTNGKKVIFKSNSGLYDTLEVRINFEYFKSSFEKGNCQYSCQYAWGEGGGPNVNVKHYNQFWTSSYSPPSIGQYKFSNYTPQNNIVVNGITYNNVYVMDSTYYTKQDGVLAFPGYPGVEWYKIN